MMEERDGRKVFVAAPNPSALFGFDDPVIGYEEVDVGNIPTEPLVKVIDHLAVKFGGLEEVTADAFLPSDMIAVTAIALSALNPNLTAARLGAGTPTVILPFVRMAFSDYIMPQVRAAFEALQLKNE